MFVLCQYFSHRDAARAAEFEFCLRDHIGQGHQLILFEEDRAPEDIRRGAAQCVPYAQRITYESVFQWANAHLPAGSVAALVNLDIMLRFGAAEMEAHFGEYPEHFLCLSRLEYRPEKRMAEPDPVFERVLYRNCQDAWVFRVPVPVLPRSDFAVGNCPGCDNAIAFRAAEAGLIPVNVAGTFPIWHYDGRAKQTPVRMVYDANTQLARPEREGRLLLPRIEVRQQLDEMGVFGMAWHAALSALKTHGYGWEADGKMSNFLACLTGVRRTALRWDLRYLFTCIALNNSILVQNP